MSAVAQCSSIYCLRVSPLLLLLSPSLLSALWCQQKPKRRVSCFRNGRKQTRCVMYPGNGTSTHTAALCHAHWEAGRGGEGEAELGCVLNWNFLTSSTRAKFHVRSCVYRAKFTCASPPSLHLWTGEEGTRAHKSLAGVRVCKKS